MRYLHPVAASEKFIAKGVYRFYEGETPLESKEEWTRHHLAGGGILTRIDKESQGLTTLAEVLSDDAGILERLSIREWNKGAGVPYKTARAEYIFFPSYVQASCRFDDAPTLHEEIPLPPPPVHMFLGNFMLYWGRTYHEFAQERTKNMPYFLPVLDIERRRLGIIGKNGGSFRIIEQGTTLWKNKAYQTTTYAAFEGTLVVIDEVNIVLKGDITHPSGNKQTILTEYAHI